MKPMTKHAAWRKAHMLWGNADRHGATTLRQKKNSPRFLVGHQKRVIGNETPEPMVIMGSSDVSWEDAFANANTRSPSETKE